MRPSRLQLIAFAILAMGVVGILWFYINFQKQIYYQQNLIVQIHRNYFNKILQDLKNEVTSYNSGAVKDIRQYIRSSHRVSYLKIEAFQEQRIDGVLLLNHKNDVVYAKGVPISPDSFSICLRARHPVQGIHTCPISRNTILYSVLPREDPVVGKYTIVFYRELTRELAMEIEKITNYPVRFIPLNQPPESIAGYLFKITILYNVDGIPLMQMVSYYHKSLLTSSRNLFIMMIILIISMGLLAYITTSLSRTAILAKTLKIKNLQLKKMTQQRECLLHILSHDLNNYLSIISGYSEISLMEENLPEKVRNHLIKIFNAAKKQNRIINFIKQQRALESGKLELNLKPTELHPLICQLIEDFNLKLQEKEISVQICPDIQGVTVLVEPLSFSVNVLNNLFSNAIKFSLPNSQIKICIAKNRNGRVSLLLEDNGIGIPSNLLKDIWKPHKRTTRKGTNGELGT